MTTPLKVFRTLILTIPLVSLTSCMSREQWSGMIDTAVPLKETAFIPFPVLVGPMDPVWLVIRAIFVPLAFAATAWGLLQWQRHGRDLGRFVDTAGKGFVFMTLFGAPAVALIGFHDIAYGLWLDWINFGFVRDALHWVIPCVETSCSPQDLARGAAEAIRDPLGTAGAAAEGLATLKVAYIFVEGVPVWHMITEATLLLTFPFALGLSFISKSFKPLIVWLFAYGCYALFPILWAIGITWSGSNVGGGLDDVISANKKFIGITFVLEMATWIAPWVAAGMLLFTGRSEERPREARVQISPETLDVLTAMGVGYLLTRQEGKSASGSSSGGGWNGQSGPTAWSAGPPDRLRLPPPNDGPRTSPDSTPLDGSLEGSADGAPRESRLSSSQPIRPAASQSAAGKPDGRDKKGPASMTLDTGSQVLGGAAAVAAAVILPESAPLAADKVEDAAKSGPLGELAEKMDERAAEAGFEIGGGQEPAAAQPESEELRMVTEMEPPREQQPSEEVPTEAPSARETPFDRGNTSQRVTFYARDDLIVDGRMILRKGQIVFYDKLTGDGAVVDGVEVPGHLLRTRGEEWGEEV